MGERHYKAKLTRVTADFINNSPEPHAKIARWLGVHPNTVAKVRRGETWRENNP